jgi:hypothetical protein
MAISTSPYAPHQRSAPPAFRDHGLSFHAFSDPLPTYISTAFVHHHFVPISVTTPTAPQPVLSCLGGVVRRTWRRRSHIVHDQLTTAPQTRCQTRASNSCLPTMFRGSADLHPRSFLLAQASPRTDRPPLHVQAQLPPRTTAPTHHSAASVEVLEWCTLMCYTRLQDPQRSLVRLMSSPG